MSLITAILTLVVAIVALVHIFKPSKNKSAKGPQAPGPRAWPIIGNLPYIGKFPDLIAAFSSLQEEYGEVASIKLGVHNSVVISGLKNFREVLLDKGHLFDARPAFKRFDLLFGGNKDNSLAFADGSEAHYKHRAVIAIHSMAKNGSQNLENFETYTGEFIFRLMEELKEQVKHTKKIDLKPAFAEAVACIFIKYLANIDVDHKDELFQNMVSNMDLVFQEINSGSIGDVLPYLMPFINKGEYAELSKKIREFFHKRCFEPIMELRTGEKISIDDNNNEAKVQPEKSNDMMNGLLDLIDQNEDISLNHCLYAFEDIVGGHAAVSNSLIRILHQLAKNPEVQQKIRQEVREQASGFPTLSDRLTYTEAAIWEGFRFITSPIVPHVASQDTVINEFPVQKGTIVFFNNHSLNFSTELWEDPNAFLPERFITSEGRILKPEYFLPFSTGKRQCLGYKMAMDTCKVIIANLCLNFEISLDPSTNYDMERGIIAVGKDKICPFIYTQIEE